MWGKKVKLEYWTDEELKIKNEEWLQKLKDGEDERKEKIKQYYHDMLNNKIEDDDFFRRHSENQELKMLQESLERERESDADKQKREEDKKRRCNEQKPPVWTAEEKRQMADEDKQRRWKMRKSTFLSLGVILGFPFLMSLCDSSKDRDPSNDDYYERIPARGVRDL